MVARGESIGKAVCQVAACHVFASRVATEVNLR